MAEAARARGRRPPRDGTRPPRRAVTASPAAWAAAGAAARMLHDAPLPPWPGRSLDEIASELDGECEWLVTNGVLSADLVTRNRRVAEAALRPWTPVFTHGDLQVAHVFAAGDHQAPTSFVLTLKRCRRPALPPPPHRRSLAPVRERTTHGPAPCQTLETVKHHLRPIRQRSAGPRHQGR